MKSSFNIVTYTSINKYSVFKMDKSFKLTSSVISIVPSIHTSPFFVIETTLYTYMSALLLGVGIFITFNKENYHVYCFM